MSGKVSLQELIGKDGAESGLSLANLPDILGDAMPELPKNTVGRFRLVRALQQRFGKNFRSIPGVQGLIKEFDGDIEFEGVMTKLKGLMPKEEK